MSVQLPVNAQTVALAQRLVWFEPPEQALSDTVRLLAYAFRYGRASDMAVLRNYLNDDDLRDALRRAPPGIIDPRSWAYWHLLLDMQEGPLPQRELV